MPDSPRDSLRIDKWLWAARFYKTRALASKGVTGGKVKLNGARIKPAHAIVVGDQVEINKVAATFVVDVLSLSPVRGSATRAREMYEEIEASKGQRQQRREQSRLMNQMLPRHPGRPNKHDRRVRLQLKGKL